MKKTVWALLVSLLLPVAAAAYEPKMDHFLVTNNQRSLILFSQFSGAFNEEILDAFKNGLPLEFTFEIKLVRERQFWPDSDRQTMKLSHSAKFDMLKEEYTFTATYNGHQETRTTDNLMEVQRWMTRLDGVELFPLDAVGRNRRYFIEARAQVSSTVDLSTRNILFFFKGSGNYQTDWHRSPLFSIGAEK